MTTPPERIATRSSAVDALGVFSVLWALVATWHVLGRPQAAPAWAQALLLAGVAAVLLRPGAALPLGVLAAGGLVTAWEEAPGLTSPWLLAAIVDLGVLLALVVGVARRRPGDRLDLANRVLPVARLCLLGVLAFGALARLNDDYLDRAVSCVPVRFVATTDSLGLSGLQLGGAGWVEEVAIWLSLAVALAAPVLLVFRRTRHLGVLLVVVHQVLLALDRGRSQFAGTAVVVALAALFLSAEAGAWVVERAGSARARLALRHPALPRRAHRFLVAVPVVLGGLAAIDVFGRDVARVVGWWSWQAAALVTLAGLVRFLGQHRTPPAERLRPHHAAFAVVPLLVVVNGLTPYLELKTTVAWTADSNLRTVAGETNHLLLPGTLPLRSDQDDVVTILDSSSATLARYAAHGYGMTYRQLRAFLAAHPRVSVTYRRAGRIVALRRASDRPALLHAEPTWRAKLAPFRPIDLGDDQRCGPAWAADR